MATTPDLDFTSRLILAFIARIDAYGKFHYRTLASVSAGTALALWYLTGKNSRNGGIAWHSLIHTTVMSLGAFACVYLDMNASEILTGVQEPLRTLTCQGGALTSLHDIIPAIALGYSVGDIVEGIALRKMEYIFHGILLGTSLLFFCEIHMQHTSNGMLLMECSTIFLSLSLAKDLPAVAQIVSQLLFAASFFGIRLFVTPYLWYRFVKTYFQHADETCVPDAFMYIAVIFGVAFHVLNVYWSYKLIRKIRRKLLKVETMTNSKLD